MPPPRLSTRIDHRFPYTQFFRSCPGVDGELERNKEKFDGSEASRWTIIKGSPAANATGLTFFGPRRSSHVFEMLADEGDPVRDGYPRQLDKPIAIVTIGFDHHCEGGARLVGRLLTFGVGGEDILPPRRDENAGVVAACDRKSTRLNSSH